MCYYVHVIYQRGDDTQTHTHTQSGKVKENGGGSVESKRKKIKEEIKWGGAEERRDGERERRGRTGRDGEELRKVS